MSQRERTADEIAEIYDHAAASVKVIDSTKGEFETEDYWKDRVKRNWRHLEIIKSYKKADEETSIWTTEDFTAIDAAIIKGKGINP